MYPKHPSQKQDESELFKEYSLVIPTSTVRHMSSRKINKFMKFFNGKTMKADLVEDEIKIKIPYDKTTELDSMLKTVLSNLDQTVYYIHDVNREINHLLELQFKKMGSLGQGDWRYLPSEGTIKVKKYEDVYNKVRLTVFGLKKYQYQMDTLDVSKTKLSLKDTLQSFKDQEEFRHVLVEPIKDSKAINIHYPIDQQAQAVMVKNWLQVKLELIRTTGRRNRRFDNYISLQIDGGQEIVNNAGTTSREATERPKEELNGRSAMRPDTPLYSSSLFMPAPQKEPLQGFIGHTKEMHDDSTEAIYCTEKKLVIKVYKGDIKNLKVDCIVNTANEDLFHEAGIAAVIARAAGRDFDRECRNFIRDNGKLHVNQCISTTAGNLSYRYVLHAVGPMWGMYKDKSDCEDDLMQTIVNILRRAECLDMKSVAIPSISSGIFGVPWNVCAAQYARGICRFEEISKGVVKEVHFIDINEDILKEVRSVFNLMFQSFKDQEEFRHVLVEPIKDSQAINIHYPIDQQAQAVKVKNWLQVGTTGRRNRRFDNYISLQIDGGQEIVNNAGTTSREATERPKEELSGRSTMRPDTPLYSSSLFMPAPQKEPLQGFIGHTKEMHDDSTEAIYCTEKKLVIKVYKGDIKNLKVDCIVNTANEDLFHEAGIAAVIARAAGRDFDRECRNFIRDNGKLHVNQCISTTAGNLSYRYVLHAVGPMWGMYKDKSDCEDDLMQTIVNILRRAECLDMKSVAISSISSGIFGVPWNVCAAQYARGICRFEEISKGVVKEVHFIDINEDILKEVRSVFNLMFQKLAKQLKSATGNPPQWMD